LRAHYGIDAPYVPVVLGLIGVIAVVAGVLVSATWLIGVGVVFLLEVAVYLQTTLRGKFRLWDKLLDQLALSGDERVLDLGCGRGAVLLAAARRLPRGKAQGVDLWRSVDQSGNGEVATRHNAEAVRVLRPGGRLVLAYLRYTRRYAGYLREAGLAGVRSRTLGPDGWFAGPWQAMSVVTATKP